MTSTTSGRKRANAKTYTADDQALGQIAREAEAKLAAKRAARNEAREIRMRELEKQQKENEEKQDRLYELTNDIPKASMRQFGGGSSRRGSEDSTTDEGSREMRSQLAELDEKYKKAMMGTAQLHNEKQSLVYEVELLKDQLEEREEEVIESQREFRDKCKELESKKRSYRDLDTEFKNLKIQIEQRDKLIEENGLAIVISDEGEWTLVKASAPNGPLSAGLPTMGMVNSRLASEADTSLAYEDFRQHKCIQTDPCRNAPTVFRRLKATQTDQLDPAIFRKAETVATEIQTDDVPELLRAAIEHAEKITQTPSKPLEMSLEERFMQLLEYYRDVQVQTVESKFAPWTASHTIEEPPPKPKQRTPTPPPVVEVEPEEEEIEQLRVELNEDPIFDPSRFRKRMMSLTGSGGKDAEKKPSKGEVDPKVETKPTPAPPPAPVPPTPAPVPPTPAPAPVAQKPEAVDIEQLFEIVEDEPVFSSSRHKKKSSRKAETQAQSASIDQIFDTVEDEPVFDPSRYLKQMQMQPKPEAQIPASESKPEVAQQSDPIETPKPPTEVQRQASVGSDQIFDTVEKEPVFDPSRYKQMQPQTEAQPPVSEAQPQTEAQPPVSESQPNVTQQSDPVETPKPPTEVQRQISVGFDQIFDNVEEPVFDPSRYMKRLSALPTAETQPPPATVSQQPPTEIKRQESVGFDQIFDNVDEEPVFDPSRYLKGFSASAPSPERRQTPTKERSRTPCDAPSSQPSLDPSVSSSVESSHKTNKELSPSSGRDGYVSTSDSSSPAPPSHLCPVFDSQATQNDDGYSVPESGTNLSIPPPCGPESETESEMDSEVSHGASSEAPTSILDENQHLKAELKKLTDQLEEERSKKKNSEDNQIFQANGPEMQLYEIQREASKQIHEYKLKLQKAEQDIATLEGSVNRLDTQVKRYRTEAEDSEKLEDELKQEKRKLMRELREAQSQIEELRNHNSHLQKRLEKMKQSRSALVK